MSILNICKGLIVNKRLYGASSFLAQFKGENLHERIIAYSMRAFILRYVQNDGKISTNGLAKTLEKQLLEEQKLLEANFVNTEPEKVLLDTFKLCCAQLSEMEVELPATIFFLFTSRASDSSLKKALASYLISDDALLNSEHKGLSILFSENEPAEIRSLLTSLEGRQCASFKAVLLQLLINKIESPYWEYYNLAQQFTSVNSHRRALTYYIHFFDKALTLDDQGPIKYGLLGILNALFYAPEQLDNYKTFLEKAPPKFLEDKEIQALVNELALIIGAKETLGQKVALDKKLAGYSYLDRSSILQHTKILTKAIQVAPSYNSFYELYKLNAMLGNKEQARAYLKDAYQANTLLLRVG